MVNGVTIERVISIRLMFKVLSSHTTTVMGEVLLLSLPSCSVGGKARLLAKVMATAKGTRGLKGLCSSVGMRRTDFFLLAFAAKEQKKQTQVGVSRSFTFSSREPPEPEGKPRNARLQKW